ncbi:MAG: tRNA pseudouridine(38-40) synthase TruA [Planctomycetes bacterium]|nr:tRNA pseudouridine(38-40) synthase TruA [Planctomycetota bacterium]
MSTWKLTLEYAGTRFRGWQEQPGERTVAGEIGLAARGVFREEVELGGAGRTDAGVHALAQVAHLRGRRTVRALADALNAGLPADVHVLAAEPAAATFHARRDAVSRSYLYQVSRRRNAFLKPYVWWVRERLDLEAMRRAAALLAGMHDFAAFAEPDPEIRSTRVRVLEARVEEHGSLLLLRLHASHFLWKMVRRLAGALVRLGAGDLDPARFQDLLESGRGSVAEWTAPPSGLFLEQVLYRGDVLRPLQPAIRLADGTPGAS